MITDAEHVAFGDGLAGDPLAAEGDAVRGSHVDHEVSAVLELHQRVLAGDIVPGDTVAVDRGPGGVLTFGKVLKQGTAQPVITNRPASA